MAALESDIVFEQSDVVLFSSAGIPHRSAGVDALGFEAQAAVGPQQPILMLQQAVGEIGRVECPLFQADDLHFIAIRAVPNNCVFAYSDTI